MASFVNINGQPINFADEEYRRRQREIRQRQVGYPSKRKPTVRNGYAAPPGTGPEGKTCKDCRHKLSLGRVKTFIKCELRRATWTNGQGTDILASSPACKKFEPKE